MAAPASVRLIHVVGARPNFMKLAPVWGALARTAVAQDIVHTGQHYDPGLSGDFFRDLEIPAPRFNLEVGSGSHAAQTGEVMKRFDGVLDGHPTDVVLVYGDVNSTVAAALVAAKRGIRVGHVEAGLRSGDWSMPEEVNRVVTDRLADLLFTPSRDADENLAAEGVPPERIRFVGNVMVDTLLRHAEQARALGVATRLGLTPGAYGVVTLHRPSNVDEAGRLAALVGALDEIARDLPLVFPAHPRTVARLRAFGLAFEAVHVTDPVGYLEMLSLVADARGVVTDSGGLQEETTALGIPCVTVRPNTERPVTITDGTNVLAPADPAHLAETVRSHFARPTAGRIPEGWDGHAGERIAAVLMNEPAG